MSEADKAYGLLLGGCKTCKHFWNMVASQGYCLNKVENYDEKIHRNFDNFIVYREIGDKEWLAAPAVPNESDACEEFNLK
jgi:hypothetical protein